MSENLKEALRWFKQAEKDLISAKNSLEIGDFESGFKELKKGAKVLDSVYISARYPNGIAGDLAPFEYYEKEDAEECVKYAGLILEDVRKLIRK